MAQHPKQLIVEDNDTRGMVSALMGYHVPWGVNANTWPCEIRPAGSADQVLDPDALYTAYMVSGLQALGIIVDADDKFGSRWAKIKQFCDNGRFSHVPRQMPKNGLILKGKGGKFFGAWIMPDNQSSGMVETFCKYLVPDKHAALWSHAEEVTRSSKIIGAPWIDAHREKAEIHSWLAWQNPPGERMGPAITKKMLDPHSSYAKPFVAWFKKLYMI